MSSEKLQKVLARAGIGSRREMERQIDDGRVEVNGRRATLGDRVNEDARIRVDGRLVGAAARSAGERQVIAYHKPTGELVTRHDPEGRKTIFPRLPRLKSGRWLSVGRLDINSSGLLLLTTDGELANRLAHPAWQMARDYAVRIYGPVEEGVRQRLLSGVALDDGNAAFESIQALDPGEQANRWYRVRLREGKNRLVRRLWESQGVQVSRLIRVQYGPYEMPPRLREGQYQSLTPGEIRDLVNRVGLTDTATEASSATGRQPGARGSGARERRR